MSDGYQVIDVGRRPAASLIRGDRYIHLCSKWCDGQGEGDEELRPEKTIKWLRAGVSVQIRSSLKKISAIPPFF